MKKHYSLVERGLPAKQRGDQHVLPAMKWGEEGPASSQCHKGSLWQWRGKMTDILHMSFRKPHSPCLLSAQRPCRMPQWANTWEDLGWVSRCLGGTAVWAPPWSRLGLTASSLEVWKGSFCWGTTHELQNGADLGWTPAPVLLGQWETQPGTSAPHL